MGGIRFANRVKKGLLTVGHFWGSRTVIVPLLFILKMLDLTKGLMYVCNRYR